jgi:hypothetical protein
VEFGGAVAYFAAREDWLGARVGRTPRPRLALTLHQSLDAFKRAPTCSHVEWDSSCKPEIQAEGITALVRQATIEPCDHLQSPKGYSDLGVKRAGRALQILRLEDNLIAGTINGPQACLPFLRETESKPHS